MKKFLSIGMGIVTGIGGFLEAGSIATSAQAGAQFHYQLIWAIALGTLGLIFLVEMSGRLAAVSRRTLADAMRERFGFNYFVIPLAVVLLVSYLTLAAELGGVAMALQMATGIAFQVWAFPLALLAWFLLWNGTFDVVENGTALLGLVAIVFAVGAIKLHPAWTHVGAALLPSAPTHDKAHYWFLAVSIVGASIGPYLYFFYSSGGIEEKWEVSYIWSNRIVAGIGNAFGGLLAIAVLIVAAQVFGPRGIQVDRFEQLGLALTPTFGEWGFALLLAALGINCFGATAEIALASAYLIAQGLGWDWGEDAKPRKHARFALSYTVLLILAALLMAIGLDPLKLTNISVALAAASLPVTVIPLVVLMNDRTLMFKYHNRWISNTALAVLSVLSVVLLVAAIPLQFMGGG